LVHAITAYICAQQHIPTLKELSAHVHFSSFYVNRVFKSQTGVTPRQYAAGIQRERLEELLRGKHERITDAILDAGYSTVGNAYYAQSFGMTLRDVRRGGDGWNIAFGIIPTEYGELCVAQTTRGVCRVFFVASLTDAQEQLKTTYPHASITHDQLNMQEVLETVRTLAHQTSPNAEIRIDIRATAFQLRVYDVLRRIPVGSTRTYKQIAEEVGNPRAARAVAQACAQNPLAVLIPCHRVVHSNGAREGYRWGIARKQSILDNEHQSVSTSNALMKEGEA
jgi:AraC family transcriptional regulator of adaptative response/methylated-DNA-[protein]-cysteine methyltransferase